ncbi:MAG: DNA polymerase ligase N-terminal domain-containing protein [Bacteroidota bacterium]|nr:DNA polymerase ligase N-terminal domain-containing protein [Bacteroidota bacterium]MDP4249561.1 DNA polymerase ligase N-terminal domain-containing protein [Bacteroidota bacterium]
MGKPHKTDGANGSNGLIFVVQRHQATHLHYDFRLEMNGVLKSWAIPKGPSMSPSDRRLAVMVEDHPLYYAGFEGIIAEGNYGAGTVEIWDHGTWQPDNKLESPLQALRNGSLEFTLNGEKIKGKFVLVKMEHSRTENAWLLIKRHDQYAVSGDYDGERPTKYYKTASH